MPIEPLPFPSGLSVPIDRPAAPRRTGSRAIPLIDACAAGDVVTVLRRIREGESLNDGGVHRWTPLHYAVASAAPVADTVEIVRTLRQAGARDDLVNRDGDTAWALARRYHLPQAVLSALSTPVDASSMLWTVLDQWRSPARGYAQRCRQALRLGAQAMDRHPDHQETALAWAVHHDCGGAIACFHRVGTDLNQRLNTDGMTALMEAALYGRLFATYALLHAGVDVHRSNDRGNTALHLAFMDPAVVAALLAAGANPSDRDAEGRTMWEKVRTLQVLTSSSSEREALASTYRVLADNAVRREKAVLQTTLNEVAAGIPSPAPARPVRRL